MAKVKVKDGLGETYLIPKEKLEKEMKIREQIYNDFLKVGAPKEYASKYLFEIVRVED